MKKPEVVEAVIGQYADFCDFQAHVENGEIVVDKCEGISPQGALSIFPAWALKELTNP
jgi:hypothetical protein